jgi:hypothetical protein
MNTGMFNRPEQNPFSSEGVRKILEMIDFGYWEGGIDEDEELQESKAKRENRELLEGMLIPINDYDSDEIHIREHYRFMMSSDYDEIMASENGPDINELFMMHIGFHKQRIQQIQMQQQLAQMQMQNQQPTPK